MRKRWLAMAALLWATAGAALAEECARQYFAPDDVDAERPLRRPARELAATLKAARAGDAAAQRSLAVSYEAGYLVARCADQALHWYRKAAEGGDAPAQDWLNRHDSFARLQAAPECAQQCPGSDAAGSRSASFTAGPNGHYFAPVTINGITITGMIDTGASTIAMSEETARRFKIETGGGKQAQASTANGKITNTMVTLPQVTVGGIPLQNVRVAVGITGEMLIGMSFLSRLNLRMEGGQLTMAK